MKVASTVRRGAVGKAFSFARSSSLAAYPTFGTTAHKSLLDLEKRLLCVRKGRFDGTRPWGRFIQLLDSGRIAALSYRHAFGRGSQKRQCRLETSHKQVMP